MRISGPSHQSFDFEDYAPDAHAIAAPPAAFVAHAMTATDQFLSVLAQEAQKLSAPPSAQSSAAAKASASVPFDPTGTLSIDGLAAGTTVTLNMMDHPFVQLRAKAQGGRVQFDNLEKGTYKVGCEVATSSGDTRHITFSIRVRSPLPQGPGFEIDPTGQKGPSFGSYVDNSHIHFATTSEINADKPALDWLIHNIGIKNVNDAYNGLLNGHLDALKQIKGDYANLIAAMKTNTPALYAAFTKPKNVQEHNQAIGASFLLYEFLHIQHRIGAEAKRPVEFIGSAKKLTVGTAELNGFLESQPFLVYANPYLQSGLPNLTNGWTQFQNYIRIQVGALATAKPGVSVFKQQVAKSVTFAAEKAGLPTPGLSIKQFNHPIPPNPVPQHNLFDSAAFNAHLNNNFEARVNYGLALRLIHGNGYGTAIPHLLNTNPLALLTPAQLRDTYRRENADRMADGIRRYFETIGAATTIPELRDELANLLQRGTAVRSALIDYLTDPTITHANNFAELLHDDRGPEFDTAIAHGQALNENQIVHIIDTLAFGPNFTPMDRSNRLLSHMIDEAMVNAGFFQLEGVGDNMAQFGVAGVLNHGSGH